MALSRVTNTHLDHQKAHRFSPHPLPFILPTILGKRLTTIPTKNNTITLYPASFSTKTDHIFQPNINNFSFQHLNQSIQPTEQVSNCSLNQLSKQISTNGRPRQTKQHLFPSTIHHNNTRSPTSKTTFQTYNWGNQRLTDFIEKTMR